MEPIRQHRPRRNSNATILLIIVVLALILAGLIAVIFIMNHTPTPSGPTNLSSEPSSTTETTAPPSTEPSIIKESTVTLSAVGDMLMHKPVFSTCKEDGGYDFDSIFRYFAQYIQSADISACNIETTFAGLNNGYAYQGYPNFNCPDELAADLKDAGFDLALTANNHSYDTGSKGFHRTMQVVQDAGLTLLGTKTAAENPDYFIFEKNGIRLAMACYTYEVNDDVNIVSPNGHTMKSADAPLIKSFQYSRLDLFYEEIQQNMAQMEEQNVDAFILFIHWGDEYQLKQNSTQSKMAQKLCDLGVDVIIGGHPHVVQPTDLLTSTVDPSHSTVCLYSMGNAVSNQRLGNISYVKTPHTEDGLMFSVTFARYSDGTVILESADALPLWVRMGTNPGTNQKEYNILPLDKGIANWQGWFHLSDSELEQCNASYQRTMKIIGKGMEKINTYLTANQLAVEAQLGVS